ncbi:MAG: hypothetical protein PHD92_08190 [Eubacteriales bacterium]|nr:hypothetical protein [Eubacteriales bacterium]
MTETANCKCKWVKCPRHGKCQECIEHHRGKKHPPWCRHPNRLEEQAKPKR